MSLCACGGSGYSDGTRFVAGSITTRSLWSVSGQMKDVRNATDGNVGSVALGEGAQQRPNLVIDLGKECLFNMIVIDHGPRDQGYCRRLAVSTSDDGKSFHRQAEAPGQRRVTTVLLPRAVLTRYVRLEVIEPGDNAWAVAEVYLN